MMDITITTIILFATFFVLLFLSVPISISILASSVITISTILGWDQVVFIIMQKMNTGIESFSLLAIPLFIFAGNIMNNGGIARKLVDFAQAFVGRIPGSLAQTNALGNMFFGALSGSAVAAAAAIGGTLYPIQKEENYDSSFATSVNIASAPTGMLIPPATSFIVYSTVAGGVSVAGLFMAGIIPGVLMGLTVMIIAYIYAKKRNYKTSEKVSMKERVNATLQAVPSILMVVIVVGGIVGGVFTATEGAGISVLYSLVLSIIYKKMTIKKFMRIVTDSARTSGIILFLVSASSAMSWVMAYTGIPGAISRAILSVTENSVIILLLMAVILLVIGTFMDMTPALLIFTPIFLPIAENLGMHPIHFGVFIIMALCVGVMTPPVGSVLFVGAGISKLKIEEIVRPLIPYLIALSVLLLAVLYIPSISLFIPDLIGLL